MTKSFAKPFGSLMMPVEFTIENGDFTNSTLNVKKDGETVLSKIGEKNMRLKLEYGNNYLLSFSKPGYITKKIEVNTDVPEEHGKQGFEPYKIGVRLFKQYQGVNIVVYNQPVALIKYLADLDGFNYDVDYTKSILSVLTETEKILEIKAAEERAQLKANISKSPNINLGEVSDNKKSKDSQKQNSSTNVNEDLLAKNSSNSISDNNKNLKKSSSNSGEETPKVINPIVGDDKPTNASNNNGSEIPALFSSPKGNEKTKDKISIQQDQDTVHFSSSNNIDELPVVHFKRDRTKEHPEGVLRMETAASKKLDLLKEKGNDFPQLVKHEQSGNESPITSIRSFDETNRTIEKTVEPNRVITTIRIIEGDHTTEYRHIVYNWGGEFYFVNKTEAISPHLFNLYTGQ